MDNLVISILVGGLVWSIGIWGVLLLVRLSDGSSRHRYDQSERDRDFDRIHQIVQASGPAPLEQPRPHVRCISEERAK